MVLTSFKFDQYSSEPKEISKLPLMYMAVYFCRSVYKEFKVLIYKVTRVTV